MTDIDFEKPIRVETDALEFVSAGLLQPGHPPPSGIPFKTIFPQGVKLCKVQYRTTGHDSMLPRIVGQLKIQRKRDSSPDRPLQPGVLMTF